MKAHEIPKGNTDLKAYAFKKNAKRLLGFFGYVAFFFLAFWFYLERRYEDAEPFSVWVYIIFTAVVLVSGWVICRMGRFVGESNFSGEIKRVALTRNYDLGLSREGKLALDEHTYLKIATVTENGKRKRVKVQLFDDGYDGYYREGGTVVCFRGLNYPLCLESEGEGSHLCGVCGVRTFYKDGRVIHGEAQPELKDGRLICRVCKHTLINVEEIRGNN